MAMRTTVIASALAGASAFTSNPNTRNIGNLRSNDNPQAAVQPTSLEASTTQATGANTIATIGLAAVSLALTAKAARTYKHGEKMGRRVAGPPEPVSGETFKPTYSPEEAPTGEGVTPYKQFYKNIGGDVGKLGPAFRGPYGPSQAGDLGERPVGVCPPLYSKWDPLNLSSTEEKFARYTAVEIKHGRISMIAVLGYILPEYFKFPGCENFKHGLKAFETIPLEGWIQLIAFIGAHEALVKPREGAIHSQDFGLGTELFDPVLDIEKIRRQTVERNNGRLAMVAIIGMMWQDGTFGVPPVSMWGQQGWWAGWSDKIVRGMPVCYPYDFDPFPGGQGVGSVCALPIQPRNRGFKGRNTSLTARRVVVYEDPFASSPLDEPENPYAMMPPVKEMSPACPWLPFPEHLRAYPGGEAGFDPMGWSEEWPVPYMRECELKHGRITMLATLGWIATDLGVRFPGSVFQNTDTINAHNDLVKAGVMLPFLCAIGVAEIYGYWLFDQSGYAGNDADPDYFPLGQIREPGDFYLGKNFLPSDPEKKRDMQLKELKNGRLAMLAFSGIATVSVAFGKKWPFF